MHSDCELSRETETSVRIVSMACYHGDRSPRQARLENGHFFHLNVISFISRVPNQNGVSQVWYIVEVHHSGRKPSIFMCMTVNFSMPLTNAMTIK